MTSNWLKGYCAFFVVEKFVYLCICKWKVTPFSLVKCIFQFDSKHLIIYFIVYIVINPFILQTDLDVTGDLEVSVEFQHPSSLLVTIHGAHGLSARDNVSLADPFVKVTVPGTKLMFQTKVWHIESKYNKWASSKEFNCVVKCS